MQRSLKNKIYLGFLVGLCVVAASMSIEVTPASAQGGRPYFIEFRARNAASYGHTFVLYGQVGTKGKIEKGIIAGFHPAGDTPDCENCSALPWMIGHFLPVPAETGASDGDNEPELYLTARYRILLTAPEYKIVEAYIKQKQAKAGQWHALFNNCNQFAADIAEYIGLKVPSTWNPSRIFVNEMEEMNGGKALKSAKLPDGAVRDAPNFLKMTTVDSSGRGSKAQ